jgi:hypothetical protein
MESVLDGDDAATEALRDLALRLLDPAFSPRTPAEEPQLFVGKLPPDPPVTIPIPEDSRLVGSYVDHRKDVTVLLDVPMAREAVFAYYHERLTSMDWVRIEDRPSIGGIGPSPKRPSRPSDGGTYCRSAHGPALLVFGVASSDHRTELRLDLKTDPLHTPCARPGHPPGSDPTTPILLPPPDTEFVPRSAGGGQQAASFWGHLITDLDVRIVVSHYAQQLEQAGWMLHAQEEQGPYAWSTWIYRADDMPDRYGILFLSLLQHVGPHPRSGASQLTERPEMVQQYTIEVHTRWRAEDAHSRE